MTVDAHRARGRKPERTGLRALLVRACLFAMLAAGVTPALAQETVIIGGNRGGTSFIGGPRSGVTINNEVLDSLSPAGPASGLPYRPPTAMPSGAPMVAPGLAGTAYRMPGTGQLVVSRPSTLLFPPLQTPGSRLTVTPPARAQSPAAAPQMATAEEPRSRLLVPPPPREAPPQTEIVQPPEPAPPVEPVREETIVEVQPPSAPVEEPPAAPEPAPEPKPEPEVTAEPKPAPEPEPQAAAVTPSAPEPAPVPVEPAATPPAPPVPPSLTQELQATAEPPPAPEPPAKAEAPPPPPSEVLAPAKAPETQTAALPPPTTGLEEVRVLFKEGSAELSNTAKRELDAFAKLLNQDTSSRIQLLAYAKAADSASRARRLSLSRALAVRAYLIDKGVRSTRMDVRALGHNVKVGPADRVDILPQAARQ